MLVAVYGTLREGDYNHEYLGRLKPLSVERVQGFEMFNLGGQYPYIARGGDDITVELYDVPSDMFARIEDMERGAGYDLAKCKTTLGLADIFYMKEVDHANMQTGPSTPPKIISGDWFEWLKKYKPQRLAGFVTLKPRAQVFNVITMEGDGDAI